MKKSVLISYQAMMVGGSTTSLLGLLNTINYDKYDIDLLLNTNTGELLDKIPPEVNLLAPAYRYPNHKIRKLHSLLSPKFMKTYIKSRKIGRQSGNHMHGVQFLESQDVIKFRQIEKEYDVAIAFLEGLNCKFVANHINAKNKVAWIHVDYEEIGFNPIYDFDAMKQFNHIVTVSDKCKIAFQRSFPKLNHRVIAIENILSPANIENLSKEEVELTVDKSFINLVSSSRIEFQSKALDRAVRVLGKMKREGELNHLRWYIIGEGKDYPSLRKIIKEEELEEIVFTLGQKTNPYPIIKLMDVFFQPSRIEGKPMAVTEGMILGLPALITNYSSAQEQIKNKINGLIIENSEEGIKEGLKYLINNREKIIEWKKRIRSSNLIDERPIKQIEKILDT